MKTLAAAISPVMVYNGEWRTGYYALSPQMCRDRSSLGRNQLIYQHHAGLRMGGTWPHALGLLHARRICKSDQAFCVALASAGQYIESKFGASGTVRSHKLAFQESSGLTTCWTNPPGLPSTGSLGYPIEHGNQKFKAEPGGI